MAAALPIIKVVGIALSAKSAIEGIKEGNFLQAVIGGIGAYMGVSSLASTGLEAGSNAVSNTVEGAANTAMSSGANAVDQIAGAAASKGLETGAATGLSMDLTKGAISDTLSKALPGATVESVSAAAKYGDGILGTIGKTANAAKSVLDKNIADPLTKALNMGAENGLVERVGGFMKAHPELTQTGLQLAGGVMQGIADEKLLDREERLIRESRERRGSPVDVSRAINMQFNPSTRRFEMVES